MNWIVYIIKSTRKNWYYVGSSNNITRRLSEHNAKKVRSTKPYVPFVLIYEKYFPTENEARLYEKLLKDKRIEKEKIINQIEGR